ncbi:hypothetical protein [Haloarcula sp. K1]|uniref:hypothetical protein n=1 Tax=Haloarcula sp. K1 TaxID=1622207 RepID=UPI000A5AA901|nr:hypothetical protein [Haloarcula sp. K1]
MTLDKQLLTVIGAVGSAAGITVSLLSGLYSIFSSDMNTVGAIIIASMALILLAVLILAIDTRLRINQIGSDKE